MSTHQQQSSGSQLNDTTLDLTVEEIFFLELLQKQEKQAINVKYTEKDTQIGNSAQFTNYYIEPEIIQLLESLVSKQRIKKQEKGLVLLCSKCGGHASMPVLVCPRCGSTKVGKREDIYHPECDNWSPREEYVEGMYLRCPRCNSILDPEAPEGTPGFYSVSDPHFLCQDCGTSVTKNNLMLVCVKCSNKFTTFQASFLNSVAYSLASEVEPKTVTKPLETKLKAMMHPVKETVADENQQKAVISEPIDTRPSEDTSNEPDIEPETEQMDSPVARIETKTNQEKEKPSDTLMASVKRVSDIFKKPKKKKRTTKKKQKKTPEEPKIESIAEPEIESENVEPEEPEPITTPVKEDMHKVLLITENVTVSEFIIEALEEVNTPINVLLVDDGRSALKELRHKYATVIMDFDLKSIESKLILSEMERWNIKTPIIAFTDNPIDLSKYKLTVDSVLKKKQGDYRKIKQIIKKRIRD